MIALPPNDEPVWFGAVVEAGGIELIDAPLTVVKAVGSVLIVEVIGEMMGALGETAPVDVLGL